MPGRRLAGGDVGPASGANYPLGLQVHTDTSSRYPAGGRCITAKRNPYLMTEAAASAHSRRWPSEIPEADFRGTAQNGDIVARQP